MSAIKELYQIRDSKPADDNFILATFLRGVYYGNPITAMIPKDIFMAHYKYKAEALVKDRNKAIVKIACLPDDEDVIIGYSILSTDYQTIHYVYVKDRFRKQGIGRSLVPQYPQAVSHLTALGISLLTKFKDCHYNPFL